MNINRKTIKQIISAVEFFYDHNYKRSSTRQLEVLGDERFVGEEEIEALMEQEYAEQWQPQPHEDLVEPQVVAVSQNQHKKSYVVVFGVGASYEVEAPDMYESPGGWFINNAFALVDMSGKRPVVEKFIVGREKDTKIKLLKKHLDSRNYLHFNDRALKKDLSQEHLHASYVERTAPMMDPREDQLQREYAEEIGSDYFKR